MNKYTPERSEVPASILIMILCIVILSGCATVSERMDRLSTPDGYAECAGADIGSTAATLALTDRIELNSIVNACASLIGGTPVATIVCAVGLSIGVYHWLKYVDNPTITAAASTLTCASALRNVIVVNQP